MTTNKIKQIAYVILTYDTDTGTFNLLFAATNTLTIKGLPKSWVTLTIK